MSVRDLVLKEPWRVAQGEPRNILDPTWQGEPTFCDGKIDWEGGTTWWWCNKCGFCGCWNRTDHYPAQLDPMKKLLESIDFYFARRTEQKADLANAQAQALYVCATALRYAATIPPEHLGDYIQQLKR